MLALVAHRNQKLLQTLLCADLTFVCTKVAMITRQRAADTTALVMRDAQWLSAHQRSSWRLLCSTM